MEEINQLETMRMIQRIKNRTKQNKTKTSHFFDKINKIENPFTYLTKGHRDSMEINKIKNENGDITIDTEEMQNNTRYCYKIL